MLGLLGDLPPYLNQASQLSAERLAGVLAWSHQGEVAVGKGQEGIPVNVVLNKTRNQILHVDG